jgi:hypothetical protein
MMDEAPVPFSVEQTAVWVAVILLGGAILLVLAGILFLRRAPRQPFFLARQQTAAAGWRLFLIALGILLLAGLVRLFGAPVALQVITPTPSMTYTPSMTFTPSLTQLPTETLPPTITLTATRTLVPSSTGIPALPPSVLHDFTSNVVPAANILLGPIVFTTAYSTNLEALNTGDVFFNPQQRIAGIFSYMGINLGVQFTAVWLRNGELVYWDPYPWNKSANGTGLVEWNLAPGFFVPGAYEVQIFIGTQWYRSGRFNIVGPAPTATRTPLPSDTRIPVVLPTSTTTQTLQPSPPH